MKIHFGKWHKYIKLYFAKEFTETIVAFDLILEKNPKDQPANFFSDKAVHYLSSPVEADWTEIEKMD